MVQAVLEKPFLFDTALSGQVATIDQLQVYLADRYKIIDLEPVGVPVGTKAPFRLEMAVASFGEIGLVSVQGSALTMSLDPFHSYCMLALPSSGWGQYQMEHYCIDNTVGQSVAYIPARAWRLLNDATGGTSVQFAEQSLIRRLCTMLPSLGAADAAALLAAPFVLPMADPLNQYNYRSLLGALQMADLSYRFGGEGPHPMLQLDDLILRCIAILLCPALAQLEQRSAEQLSKRDLQRTIRELMEWMQAHLDQPISLSDIEERASYGRRAIQQGFKAEVGCGPMQWLRKQRLYSAYEHLGRAEAGLTVGQVARSCGYLNLASFSRDFHERFKVSASVMLREARRSQKL